MAYKNYCVAFTHAGYSMLEDIVPVLVCIAQDMTVLDGQKLQALFNGLECSVICDIFIYSGETSTSGYTAEDFRVPQSHPTYGTSIGPGNAVRNANPQNSFSLGVYFKMVDEPQNRVFATTVHHGLGKNVLAEEVSATPPDYHQFTLEH